MVMAAASASGADKLSKGLDLTNLDSSVSPKSDFYQYATGGWMKKNPLPAEYSRFGTFDQLGENNRKQINELILELSSNKQQKGSVADKIATVYKMVMDSTSQNKLGVAPIKDDLKRVMSLSKKENLPLLMAWMQSVGIDVFFSLYVDADPMDSNLNLVQTYQSGLGLGNRDYYLDNDSNAVRIRNAYQSHIEKMFKLVGFSNKEAQNARYAVMQIETEIAKTSYSKVQLRDPYANYHKMSVEQLASDYSGFDWNTYLGAFNLKIDSISVSQPEPIHTCLDLIGKSSVKQLRYYLAWCLVNEAATSLGDKVYDQNFDFYGKTLSGTEVPQPRWKRAVSAVSGSMGEALGQMYVSKYFPEENKQRMLTLVKNLQSALAQRISNLQWMGDTTKAKAIEKLNAFHIKIGYPDKWRDYSDLNVYGANVWENRKNISKFNMDFMMAKASKPVDRDEWYMTPQTVNAYYNPSTNEICFPAGILQYPFFDMSADDAFNYGAIGVVIGHEMTHGFDDQGRQFDKDGNLSDWWTATDAENFKQRAHVMEAFFDSIEVAPGVKANGGFTLGENLADHGGLQISFQAFKNATNSAELETIDGLTPEQRFFLAYAGVWAANIRPEEILRRTKMDPHALGRWRVNGALPHIDAWYEAFGIDKSSPMFVEPSNRVSIW